MSNHEYHVGIEVGETRAFLIIILDVTIIYPLTARWGQQARWD